MGNNFLNQFSRHKKDFLEELKRGNIKVNFKADGNSDSKKMVFMKYKRYYC